MAPDVATAIKVQAWLKEQKIYIPRELLTPDSTDAKMVMLMPVDKIGPMMSNFTTLSVMAPNLRHSHRPLTRSRWSEEALEFEKNMVDAFSPPPSTFYSSPPTPSGRHATKIATNAALAKTRHNVQQWHDEGYQGNVTVGIIDWGYAGFNEIPGIPSLTKTKTGSISSSYNAYCQKVSESIIPNAHLFLGEKDNCEPAVLYVKNMRHGNNIAELVRRMAPKAKLLMAQANSPQQVYKAADWLKRKGADVIMHAAGWPYDSAGDGKPQMGVNLATTVLGNDEHAEGRYFPSPLATVDKITKNSGPVWVNAAGNHENWSLWLENYQIINDENNPTYHGHVIFNPKASNYRNQTCQRMPTTHLELSYYSMRWADSWPDGNMNLHYRINHVYPYTNYHYVDHQDSGEVDQYEDDYPVRRSSKLSEETLDLCLRIYVVDDDMDDDEAPDKPEWIQFQALVGKKAKSSGPNWSSDKAGRSVVNPSESENEALLAVGALSLNSRESGPMEEWVSRGPVFSEGDNILSATPSRIKPDVVASTDGATYTKWRWDCYEPYKKLKLLRFVQSCNKIYFTGTSAATAHTGGIAAVVDQWFDDMDMNHGPEDVANYLRNIATPMSGSAHGFLKLPCFSEPAGEAPVNSTTGYWASTDCNTAKISGAKSDFRTFYLDEKQKTTITLSSSSKDAYLYLRNGAHANADVIAFDNDSGGGASGTDAQITQLLEPGLYTAEATTNGSNSTPSGSYTIRVSTADPTASIRQDPSLYTFKVRGGARQFLVRSSGQVKVVVNPTGEDRALKISMSRPSSTGCSASQNQTLNFNNRQYIHIEGCTAGDGVLEIRAPYSEELLNIYRITVNPQ